MTRRPRVPYSAAEMRWLEDNRLMVIGDYHHAFVAAFGRADVTAADLRGLRKRKGWKVGRELARGRMLGRHTKYSDAEVAWLRENATMMITDYHRAFCERFDRTDVTACALSGFRKKQKWPTGRDGRFNKGVAPWSKGRKIGNNPGSARTQFKRGSRSGVAAKIYKPIGSERVHYSGYLQRKIHDGLPMQSRWKLVHCIEWEKLNGPVPKGMALKCKGERLDTNPSNWELVPRGLLPRLNGKSGRGYDQAPDELKPTIMAVAKLEHRLRDRRRGPVDDSGKAP
jgi:hypothetical protein